MHISDINARQPFRAVSVTAPACVRVITGQMCIRDRCSYASALVVPLAVLIAVMLADYASGMAKAWSAGKLCSKTRCV